MGRFFFPLLLLLLQTHALAAFVTPNATVRRNIAPRNRISLRSSQLDTSGEGDANDVAVRGGGEETMSAGEGFWPRGDKLDKSIIMVSAYKSLLKHLTKQGVSRGN